VHAAYNRVHRMPFCELSAVDCIPAVNHREKENIYTPALAFVFAWHRIGAIAAYYLKYGFTPLNNDPLHLYLSMKMISKLKLV
jgi:hypothetical protein